MVDGRGVRQVFLCFLFNLKILQHLLITENYLVERNQDDARGWVCLKQEDGVRAPWRPWMGTGLSSVTEHESSCR